MLRTKKQASYKYGALNALSPKALKKALDPQRPKAKMQHLKDLERLNKGSLLGF